MSHYMHHVPGRIRVRNPAIKRDPARATVLQSQLERLNGVTRAEVNPVTGSVTVHYDQGAIGSHDVLGELERHGCVDRARVVSQDTYLQQAASKAGGALGKAVLGMMVEKAVERGAVALIAALL
jgi:copper chaperone CopZ